MPMRSDAKVQWVNPGLKVVISSPMYTMVTMISTTTKLSTTTPLFYLRLLQGQPSEKAQFQLKDPIIESRKYKYCRYMV